MSKRALHLAAGLLLVVPAAACDGTPTEVADAIIEVFGGTLSVDAQHRFDFVVVDLPDVTVTLNSLGEPLTGGTVEIGLGVPDGDECALSLLNEAVAVGGTVTGVVAEPGTYCIRVADNGSLAVGETATYEVQVSHF